ncbi:TLDc domain-containing protein [Entamoeba marina]
MSQELEFLMQMSSSQNCQQIDHFENVLTDAIHNFNQVTDTLKLNSHPQQSNHNCIEDYTLTTSDVEQQLNQKIDQQTRLCNIKKTLVDKCETALAHAERLITSINQIVDETQQEISLINKDITLTHERLLQQSQISKELNQFNECTSSNKQNSPIRYNTSFELLINQSIKFLKEWSQHVKFSILYDTDIDGDSSSSLVNTVMYKKNLYFITIDDEGNVFGGFLDKEITTTNQTISDPKSFVFSLIRNHQPNYRKYNIRSSDGFNAFVLYSNKQILYAFGHSIRDDLVVFNTHSMFSYCKASLFDHKDGKNPLRESTHGYYVRRVLVLEMED